ncbi:GNAT family N-acetyltransferase [Nonomuraea sp. NPDC046570]|uniref:GNAT family N-acetyltransferase n=1 Tax=Nonomuraea sp. NPDC046570 TaxID=3155255 RepID=UPI0033C01CBA
MTPSQQALRTSTALTARVVRDDVELGRMAEDWEELYARSSAATPFQSYAWISSWWRAYGTPGRLRLAVVRRAGRLVAVAPLMLRRRALVPVGGGLSDFTDILLDDDDAPGTALALRGALLGEPGWDLIDFPEVRPGAAVGRLLPRWGGGSWRLPASVCLQLPGMPVDRLLDELGGRTAGKLRRGLRKLDAMDIQMTRVTAADADRAMADLIGLHAKQWENRGINEEHLRPRFARHLTGAARLLIEQERAMLTEYRIGGRLVVSDFALVGHDFVGGYLYGAHPDLRAELDILTLLLRGNLDLTHRIGRPTLSLLRGSEPHKVKWGPEEVRNQRLILGRGLPAAGYVAGARARLAAGRLLSDHFPHLAGHRLRQSIRKVISWR